MVLALLLAVVYWQFAVRRCKGRAYAEEIKRSADAERAANSAKTGFNDVLQMSKLESGEVVLAHEVVNLNEFSNDIQAIVGQRAAEASVSLCCVRLSDERVYPYVYGSPLHLRQIFLNIYGDAIKYSYVGGSVKTHLTCFGAENGTVTYRWTITDIGIGMSETFLQHIFEPFAQERLDARSVYSGTGLGMSIVKTLVDKMHGTITVKSAPNEGSTFVITLPFEIADAQQPAVRGTGRRTAFAVCTCFSPKITS